MRSRLSISMILSAVVFLAGCATPQNKEQAGMIIGSIVGGMVGSEIGEGVGKTAAVIVGAMIGASVGGAIGRSMDDTDRLKTAHALESVRTGVTSSWRNPDTGNQYTVVPTRTYDTASGPCREYQVDARIEGKAETVAGTACRQPDGSWKTQE